MNVRVCIQQTQQVSRALLVYKNTLAPAGLQRLLDLTEVKNSKYKISGFHRHLRSDSRRRVSAGRVLVLAL